MEMPLVEELERTLQLLRAKRMLVPEVWEVPLNYARFVGAELAVTDLEPADELTIRRGGISVVTLRAL